MSRGGIRGPRVAWQAATRTRYAAVISGQNPTTAAVAIDLGITHCGALKMLLKLEREGFIYRTVTKPATGGAVVRWSLVTPTDVESQTPVKEI